MKVSSFTVGRDAGWCAVTPNGLVQAERGQQVTIVISETWEQAADAVRALRERKDPDDSP